MARVRFRPKPNNVSYRILRALMLKFGQADPEVVERAVSVIWGCLAKYWPETGKPREPRYRLTLNCQTFKKRVVAVWAKNFAQTDMWAAELAADIYAEWVYKCDPPNPKSRHEVMSQVWFPPDHRANSEGKKDGNPS